MTQVLLFGRRFKEKWSHDSWACFLSVSTRPEQATSDYRLQKWTAGEWEEERRCSLKREFKDRSLKFLFWGSSADVCVSGVCEETWAIERHLAQLVGLEGVYSSDKRLIKIDWEDTIGIWELRTFSDSKPEEGVKQVQLVWIVLG